MAWADTLLPASWRGLPFAVDANSAAAGRRLAVHEYPYRDTVWPEDLGKAPRRHSIQGFIIGDNVALQRRAFLDAAEQPGTGTLQHPTLGVLQLTLLTFSSAERKDLGRVVELQMEFIVASDVLFPVLGLSTGAAALQAAVAAVAGVGASFAATLARPLAFGAPVVGSIQQVLAPFGALAISAARDAGQAAGIGAGLPGNLGRYGAGKRAQAALPTDTIATLLAAHTEAQAAVQAAAEALHAAAEVDTVNAVPEALAAVVDAVRSVAPDPADQVRLAGVLVAFSSTPRDTVTGLGRAKASAITATAALARRLSGIAMAKASAEFLPGSYDEAVALRDRVTAVLDAEITAAGDRGEDDAYFALRDLRAAVAADLTERAANLARLRLFTAPSPLPALVLAQMLYRDGTRGDDLARRADPRHPAFMPTEFRALAA